MARIGILGGTFNPPHVGHLILAQEAHDQLGLDRVVLMPVNTPPHKELHADPGPAVRAELCRMAVAGDSRFEVSTWEIDHDGPSYTADTLRALAAAQPGDELTFLVGGDMAHSLPTWREPEQILALASLGVAERQGIGREDILARLAPLDPDGTRVRFFDVARMDLSSSLIRRRAAAGLSVRYLVPATVAEYVDGHGLYRPQR
ncbi:Nicotinate-nucleotide adenylyltransferase [Paraconexibacter sp. AEG42_29]|uniref:Probable nicotinate-nucleotide adenylyltransferase n=1 Tax=Paraconexibacter sp. AEG42_29 TaxID=2997339 RepID=A0AAU7AXM3_9ACTN